MNAAHFGGIEIKAMRMYKKIRFYFRFEWNFALSCTLLAEAFIFNLDAGIFLKMRPSTLL